MSIRWPITTAPSFVRPSNAMRPTCSRPCPLASGSSVGWSIASPPVPVRPPCVISAATSSRPPRATATCPCSPMAGCAGAIATAPRGVKSTWTWNPRVDPPFLQHVLPSGFHRVRRFGWLHPRRPRQAQSGARLAPPGPGAHPRRACRLAATPARLRTVRTAPDLPIQAALPAVPPTHDPLRLLASGATPVTSPSPRPTMSAPLPPTFLAAASRLTLHRWRVGSPRPKPLPHLPPSARASDQTKPETLDGDFQGQQRGPRPHATADPRTGCTGRRHFLKQILADSGSRLAAASFNRGM